MDETVGTLGLHLSAALVAVVFTWFLPGRISGFEKGRETLLDRLVFFLCKYVIPAALIITFFVHLIAGSGIPDAAYVAGSHYLNAWLQSGGLATFVVGILTMILIIDRIRK